MDGDEEEEEEEEEEKAEEVDRPLVNELRPKLKCLCSLATPLV